MSWKKNMVIILVLIVLFIAVWVIMHLHNGDLFTGRINNISSVTVVKASYGQKLLSGEQVKEFKEILLNRYKQNLFRREISSVQFYNTMFKVKTSGESYGIGYLEQSKELVFLSFWFIPDGRDDLVQQTDDMILTVDDDIANLFKELGI